MEASEAFVAIVAIMMPVFLVLAFRMKPRPGGTGATPADQAQMQTLYETAQRMERRIESLEMLLDTEVPGWRSRSTH
jgi:phage shock protein B